MTVCVVPRTPRNPVHGILRPYSYFLNSDYKGEVGARTIVKLDK